jgi:hypothetical protein
MKLSGSGLYSVSDGMIDEYGAVGGVGTVKPLLLNAVVDGIFFITAQGIHYYLTFKSRTTTYGVI